MWTLGIWAGLRVVYVEQAFLAPVVVADHASYAVWSQCDVNSNTWGDAQGFVLGFPNCLCLPPPQQSLPPPPSPQQFMNTFEIANWWQVQFYFSIQLQTLTNRFLSYWQRWELADVSRAQVRVSIIQWCDASCCGLVETKQNSSSCQTI